MSEFSDANVEKQEGSNDEESKEESKQHICTTPTCQNVATLACPTCIKLGLDPCRFCSQTCFKSFWDEHKAFHKQIKKARADADPLALPTEFRGYKFTGSLRPCRKTPKRIVPESIMRPDYADHEMGIPISEQIDKRQNTSIKIYSEAEIQGIREACRIGREVLDIAGAAVRVGITCDEIDQIVHDATIEKGAYPSPLNYHRFPKSVCTSVNEVVCHGIPDMRPLEDGDIVNIDVSIYYNGYHGDLNETFFVGNVDEDSIRLVETCYRALAAAIDIVRPGVLYRDCGEAITRVTKPAGCSVVTTYCGHGIGQLFHTAPNVPHYAGNKAKGTMQVGHVFTIEPMINLGVYKDCLWPDGWTSVTVDGKRSAQFEHTMVVTPTGCELLTARIGQPLDRIEYQREWFQR